MAQLIENTVQGRQFLLREYSLHYFTLIGRRIVFLHQFVKKTDKTPPKELRIARQRMKELKDD